MSAFSKLGFFNSFLFCSVKIDFNFTNDEKMIS